MYRESTTKDLAIVKRIKNTKPFWCKLFGCSRGTIFPFAVFLLEQDKNHIELCGEQFFCRRCGAAIYRSWSKRYGESYDTFHNDDYTKCIGIEMTYQENSYTKDKKRFLFGKNAFLASKIEDFSTSEWLQINTKRTGGFQPYILESGEKIVFDTNACRLHSVISVPKASK